MNKNEYFSNCYNGVISNKYILSILIFIEYILTLSIQIIVYIRQFNDKNEEVISKHNFHLFYIEKIISLKIYIKIIIILAIFALIVIYNYIFSKQLLKRILICKIIINIFEIFLYRLFFIIICHILFSINSIIFLLFFILFIPIIKIISFNFLINHLYYFSLKLVSYPFDYYSSMSDIFHLIIKILSIISVHSSNKNVQKFSIIIAFIIQVIFLFFSIYILLFKSYYIMNNVFLNKARFSFILSTTFTNIIMLVLGYDNVNNSFFIIIIWNIFVMFFIITQMFYDPYKYVHFDSDENIENIYYYFFLIDHKKNESFILEEKIEEHYQLCQKCNLCKNLKNFLSSNTDYKKLYYIIYKNCSPLSVMMNELIHEMLINGKESLKNNSYFIINILYCYYLQLNKKNYIISTNLKLLYEIINEENKNILEVHILSSKQIILINEFLSKADNIINQLEETVLENNIQSKVKKFFSLLKNIFDLKEKKFMKDLFYNKNEGIINFFRHISICTLIYEEIFNVIISNTREPIKDNQVLLDNLSNADYHDLNQMIIQLDLLHFENKIIYIIGELSKYKDKPLCQLFPNVFRKKQLSIIKNKILDSKSFKRKNTPQNENENQYFELKVVIYDMIENKKIYRLLKLSLNLIYPLKMSRKILLTGIYSLEKDIIITLDKSSKEIKKEIILNHEDNEDNLIYDDIELITYKKGEKYYQKQKLVFINNYSINPNSYNIYTIYKKKENISESKINSHRYGSKISNICKNSRLSDIKSGDIYGNPNFNFLIQNQSSSTLNFYSNDKINLIKRNKSLKKNKQKRSFKNYQILLILLSFSILLFQFCFHLIAESKNKIITSNSMILLNLKNYFALYNIIFSSILSLVCISVESKGKECISTIQLYEEFYNQMYINRTIDLVSFIADNNRYLSTQISNLKLSIFKILLANTDKDIDGLINTRMSYNFVTQYITKNETKLQLKPQNITFLDAVDYMTNAFLIITSSDKDLNNIVYILDHSSLRTNTPFSHIRAEEELNEYQKNYYFLILNYQNFLQKLFVVNLQLIIKSNQKKGIYILTAELYFFANLILYLTLHIFIFFYIYKYYTILADLLDGAHKKMNLKNNDISVRDMFLQKIEKLKIIIQLYKHDLYPAILDLNLIYGNYKKFIEEKNKENEKYLKKEKYSIDINPFEHNKYNYIKIKYIKNSGNNNKYIYFNIITLIYSFCLIFIIFCLWENYNSVCNRINTLIQIHGNLSDDSYKLINYYQLMIYLNLTIEDINRAERYNISKGDNVFSNIYVDIDKLYEASKLRNKLGHYNLDNIDSYYNFNCSSYYDFLFKTNEFLRTKNKIYKDFLCYICDQSNIFKTNNYKQIFSMLLENIQIGMSSISNTSYAGLINNFYEPQLPRIVLSFITVYHYAFQILGLQIQRKSYQKMSLLLIYNSNVGIVMIYITTSFFILLIICFYILKINNDYKKITELKKVFKVCKKNT